MSWYSAQADVTEESVVWRGGEMARSVSVYSAQGDMTGRRAVWRGGEEAGSVSWSLAQEGMTEGLAVAVAGPRQPAVTAGLARLALECLARSSSSLLRPILFDSVVVVRISGGGGVVCGYVRWTRHGMMSVSPTAATRPQPVRGGPAGLRVARRRLGSQYL